MAGYASRTKPSEGALQPLWAKALALEDEKGGRVVLVSTDLIGLTASLSDWVAAQIQQKYGLERSRLSLNSSHTHTGPIVRGNLVPMYDLKPADAEAADRFRHKLASDLVTVIGAALGDLQPAKLDFAQGTAGFAANRREGPSGSVRIGLNPKGPVDHSVPVLRVTGADGKVRAVLFGYACHNTTLTGEFYQLSGDYAGYAQAALEKEFPGATALFYELCGGDQNPNPRSKLALAEQHGQTLAAEVARVARTAMSPVSGRVKAAFQLVDLPLAPHTREQFEKEAEDKNVFKARRAQWVLKAYAERRAPRAVRLPVQAIRFDRGFTLLTLGGEVVVDYALWAKSEFAREPLMVAGYTNDVPCYITNARIIREGGYEPVDSMIYYGQPGPFTEEVEPRLKDGIRRVLGRVMK